MSNKLERINIIYSKSSQLSKLSQRVQQLEQLNVILKQVMPPQFSDHCHLANVNEHTLVIHTDNASYASLLRFQAPTLCSALSKHLPQIVNKIDVRVRPKNTSSSISKPASLVLSDDAAISLQQTAESIEEGPLKEALTRLSQHHQ
ncbi:DUF721 domain-containing protein [Pseudomonadota bacterium]|nr:DUF721 domain-containing protein [Pseudomonadota bacterium]